MSESQARAAEGELGNTLLSRYWSLVAPAALLLLAGAVLLVAGESMMGLVLIAAGSVLVVGNLLLGSSSHANDPVRRALRYSVGAVCFVGVGVALATVATVEIVGTDDQPLARSLALFAVGGIALYLGFAGVRMTTAFLAVNRQAERSGGELEVFVAARGPRGPRRRQGVMLAVSDERVAMYDVQGVRTLQSWSSLIADIRALAVERAGRSVALGFDAGSDRLTLHLQDGEGRGAVEALRKRGLSENPAIR